MADLCIAGVAGFAGFAEVESQSVERGLELGLDGVRSCRAWPRSSTPRSA
jgi:hypothetical protein